MAELIVFPDAVWVTIAALEDNLPVLSQTAPVMAKPDPSTETVLQAPLVTVERTGGTIRRPVFDDATVTVECWGVNHVASHDLGQAARAVVLAMQGTVVEGVTVYTVAEVSGLLDLPDPDSGNPRFTFTVSMTTRGATAST